MQLPIPRDDSLRPTVLAGLFLGGPAISFPQSLEKRNREAHGHKTLRQSLYITGHGQPYGTFCCWDELASFSKVCHSIWPFYLAG